jgi:hypothetical protein
MVQVAELAPVGSEKRLLSYFAFEREAKQGEEKIR